MFGFEFLFLGGLLALPLVGLPLLLHLLFRRKTPVVLFSTTRFIRSSMQRTAARRKVQRWLLLAARMILLLLLILAAAQPAKKLLAGEASGSAGIVAIVIDTSYSMQLSRDGQTLLQQSDAAIQQLLMNELAGAKVAIFQSLPDAKQQTLRPASELLTEWRPLQPQPAAQPLVDRISAATAMLDAQQLRDKQLIVLSDFQDNDFPRAAATWTGGRVSVIDLHPDAARSAGIIKLAIEPDQPIPGVAIEAVARLIGRTGDSRGVSVELLSLDGRVLTTTSPRVVQFDSSGEAEIRLPLRPAAEPFMLLRAKLDGQDDLAWDNTREIAFSAPSQRRVKVLTTGAPSQASKFVTLALDPSEGKLSDWPLRVRGGPSIDKDDAVAVALWDAWPSTSDAQRFRTFVETGGSLIVMLRPGLQATWATLPQPQKDAIRPLLPGEPIIDPAADRPHRAAPPAAASGWMKELLDPRFQIGAMTTQRLVPLQRDAQSTLLLAAAPVGDGLPVGLLYRHAIGAGTVHTFASLPDPQYSTLATHPIFLPTLVRTCLPDAGSTTTQNVELGAPLKLTLPSETNLNIVTPGSATFAVTRPAAAPSFMFSQTSELGIYSWQRSGTATPLAIASVAAPAAEARLKYRDVASILPGDDVIVARSLDELRTTTNDATRPQPRWSPIIALMLLLLCAEAVLGNSSALWKLFGQ